MESWHWMRPFMEGGIASAIAEMTTFPLDLTKTRLQIQGQEIDCQYKKIRYRGVAHAIAKISREEGFLALYSGIGPAAFRQLIYGGMKRGLYLTFQKAFGTYASKNTVFFQNLFLAASSGAISTVVCNPVDILKVRMQTQRISFRACSHQLFCVDGPRGLFRGLGPNILRTAVLVGFTFSIYDEVKRMVVCDFKIKEGFYSYILASFIASVFGSLMANPFDVIKSRMMNQHSVGKRYSNLFSCLIKTVSSEGPSALLKGYSTMLCRTIPWHTVFFIANEYMWRRR